MNKKINKLMKDHIFEILVLILLILLATISFLERLSFSNLCESYCEEKGFKYRVDNYGTTCVCILPKTNLSLLNTELSTNRLGS